MQWTSDCTKALSATKDKQDKKPLKGLRKKQISMLGKFSEMIRGNLTKIQRLKLVALITIEVKFSSSSLLFNFICHDNEFQTGL